jgi:formiminotetrahydrofolate cyclodeaminase
MNDENAVTDWDVAAVLQAQPVEESRATVCISCGAVKDEHGELPCGGH